LALLFNYLFATRKLELTTISIFKLVLIPVVEKMLWKKKNEM